MPVKWYERVDGDVPNGERRRPLVGCLLLLLLLLLLILSSYLWLPGLGRALIVDESPSPASAILVLGSGDGMCEEQGRVLYEQGLAPFLLLSGPQSPIPGQPKPWAELSADYLVTQGVSREALLVLGETFSWHDAALQSLQVAREQGYTSLLIVVDLPNTACTRLIWRKVYRGDNIRLSFVAARTEWFQPNTWWSEERSFVAVCKAYGALLFNLLYGYII